MLQNASVGQVSDLETLVCLRNRLENELQKMLGKDEWVKNCQELKTNANAERCFSRLRQMTRLCLFSFLFFTESLCELEAPTPLSRDSEALSITRRAIVFSQRRVIRNRHRRGG